MLNTKTNLHYFQDQKDAIQGASQALNELLLKYEDQAILLLLSGGSSFGLLDLIAGENLTENVTISLLDERFSQDSEINNFLQLQKTKFYELAVAAGCGFLGTLPRPDELPQDLRSRWEIALKNWTKNNPKGKILATFGVGVDGHTAGIFPFPENPVFFSRNFENENWVTAYSAEGKNPISQRVTTTLSFFKLIDEAIIFASGEEKRAAMLRFLKGNEQPHQLPALGIYETKNFQVFTDIKI